jgi:TonB family protein
MKRVVLAILALAAGLSAAAQGVRKTADEFNKMSRGDTTLVILHGTANKMRKDDTRGVFYLRDATGDAYIYGLVDGRPGSKQSFAQMGIAPGDTLTIIGRRTVYNGTTIEMAGGHLLRKADGPRHAELMEKKNEPDFKPTFRGHSDLSVSFSEWVNKNLKYPKDARDAHVEGAVKLQFTVGTNGGVQEVQILQGVYPSLDNEALRVIRSSPKWKPGIKDGKPVRVTYTYTIHFVLPK